MTPDKVIIQMKAAIEQDPSGRLLQQCMREQKNAGLEQERANTILTQLLEEYNSMPIETERVTQQIEGISDTLDLVMGNANISAYLIYPRRPWPS